MLTAFRIIPPWFQQVNQTWADPMKNQHLVSAQLQKNTWPSSYKLEPAIWSRDTRQRIPCFERCQLIITWMSNIRVHSKPRLHVCQAIIWICGRHVARLRRRRRAYAPTSNTASHDDHEKINSWVSSSSFLYEYWAPLGVRAAGAPLLKEYEKHRLMMKNGPKDLFRVNFPPSREVLTT